MSEETDVSLDGVDRDAPENREYHPVSWQARMLCDDYAELEQMSEADLKHYAGTPPLSKKSKQRGVNGYR